MTDTLLSMPDLRRRALAEIRQLPGSHNVQDIAINRVTDERAENNWSLCVLSAGAADANTAARAALYAQTHAQGQLPPLTAGAQSLAVARLLRLD
jgi:hypothetical protein